MTPRAPIPRPATSGDGARIAEIYLTARRQAMPWLRPVHSDPEVRRWVTEVLLPSHEVWTTEAAGMMGAFVAIDRSRLWVEHLYVEPQGQGRGHGSALEELAQSRSEGSRQLWAFRRNTKARAFYVKRGFRPVAYRDGSANEEGEPDVRYLWESPS